MNKFALETIVIKDNEVIPLPSSIFRLLHYLELGVKYTKQYDSFSMTTTYIFYEESTDD